MDVREMEKNTEPQTQEGYRVNATQARNKDLPLEVLLLKSFSPVQGCSAGWKKNIWFMNPGFTEPFVPTPLNFVFSTITGVRLFYRCTVHLNFMNPNP
jgi:hypothetical protein